MQKESYFFDIYNNLKAPLSHDDSFFILEKLDNHFTFRKVEHCTRKSIRNLIENLDEFYDSMNRSLYERVKVLTVTDYYWAKQVCIDVQATIEMLSKPSEHSFVELNKTATKFYRLHYRISQLLNAPLKESSSTCAIASQFRALCCEGDAEKIQQFFNRKVSPDVQDEAGNTLFLIACQEGCFSAARECLKRGARTDCKNFEEADVARCLLSAVEAKSDRIKDKELFSLMEELSAKGVNLHCISQERTLLSFACRNGLISLARFLLDSGVPANEGKSPLLALLEYAKNFQNDLAFDGDQLEELAINLVQLGIDLQVKDNDKNSLLHLAISAHFENLAEALILRLNNVNIKNNAKITPLELALELGEAEIAERLIRKGARVRRGYIFTLNSKTTCLNLSALLAINVMKQAGVNFETEGKGLIRAALKQEQFCLAEMIFDLIGKDIVIEKTISPHQFSSSILYSACKYGAKKLLKRMVKEGADFHACDKKGETFLALSLYSSHEDCAEVLIEAGTDVHKGFPLTPLMIACEKKLKSSCELLLQKMAHVGGFKGEKTPLRSLLEGESVEEDTDAWDTIGVALIDDSCDCFVKDLSFVKEAIVKRLPKVASALLARIGSPDPLDCNLQSCFLLACRTPNMGEVGRALLKQIKNVNIPSHDNVTAILAAIWGGNEDLALEIKAKGAETNSSVIVSQMTGAERASPYSDDVEYHPYFPFQEACSRKMARLSAALALTVPDMEFTPDGKRPLHLACKYGQEDACRILLRRGMDPFLKTLKGISCLSFACQGGLEALALGFIDFAPDVNEICLETGRTPFMYALRHSLPTVAKKLLEHGAIAHLGSEQVTSLDIACERGYDDIAFMLLERGLYFSRLRKQGPVIHFIACKGMKKTFEWLIDKDMEAYLTDKDGRTIVIAALEGGLEETALRLVEKGFGLPTSWRSRNGDTLLHLIIGNCFSRFFKKHKEKLLQLDFFEKNCSGQTALYKLLENVTGGAQEKVDLLNELFGTCTCRDMSSSDSPPGILEIERVVAIALFSDNQVMLKHIVSFLNTKEEYLKILENLSKKYPKSDFLKEGLLALYQIDNAHIENMPKYPPLPPHPKEVHIRDFEKLFTLLNFSDPKKADYLQPKNYLKCTLEEAKKNIGDFYDDVEKQKPRMGTPKEGTGELVEFYDKISRATCLALEALLKLDVKDQKNREFCAVALGEFVDAAPHCGPRVYNNAFEQYYSCIYGVEPTFESAMVHLLSDLRKGIIRSLVRQDESYFVHDIHKMEKEYGAHLGLLDTDAIMTLDDPFISDLNTSKVYSDFQKTYTPKVITAYLQEQFHDESLRSRFIDWLKAHVPSSFEKEGLDRQYNYVASVFRNDGTYFAFDAVLDALVTLAIIKQTITFKAP
jgi:ankyrin repeat protein